MSLDERIERALAADSTALGALAAVLRAEGLSKQQVATALYEAFVRLQQAGRQADADAIADVLDVLIGWCAPSARMWPDEPDATL